MNVASRCLRLLGAVGWVHPLRCFHSRVHFVRLLLLVVGIALAGCNQSSVKLYPVTGKVLFKDQSAEGAKVVFLPAGEENAQYRGARPAATVAADGSFEMRTEPYGVGAPLGDYVVLITWFPPRDENPNNNPKNKLPNKYGDPSNPLLKASVKEGENKLDPFMLTP
jgi:hypothetical protein